MIDFTWKLTLPSAQKGLSDIIKQLEEHNLNQLQRIRTRLDAFLNLFCMNIPGLAKSINNVPWFSYHDFIDVDTLSKLCK